MTGDINASVASGRPHLIIEVADREPRGLSDFVGETAFVAVDDVLAQRIAGTGTLGGDGVRFCQKNEGGHDLRTWLITEAADEQFEACPLGVF
jgi:hypothetical protein